MILGASVMAIRTSLPPVGAPTRRSRPGGLGLGHGRTLGRHLGLVGLEPDAAAHPHERAVRGDVVGQSPGAQVVEERVEGRW